MAKVAPYHTVVDEVQYGERNVYHDHGDCEYGKRIKPEHRRSGTAGRPRCKECVKLG